MFFFIFAKFQLFLMMNKIYFLMKKWTIYLALQEPSNKPIS